MGGAQPNGASPRGDGSSAVAFVTALLVALVLSAIVTTAALLLADRFDRPALVVADATLPTIVAQIDGAVATPGAYPLPAGARVDALIRAAGGLVTNADAGELNLAARVGDGERVTIPSRNPATPDGAAPTAPSTEAALVVNINTADVAELDRLPGIGPVIGERIVAYRDQNGPFTTLDELTNIDGISLRLLERLRPYVTLDD